MKKVQVLLSSYNGAQYIQQQLDSIFKQEDVEVFCLVRDDGSTDDTNNILLECQKQYKNLEIISGENIGYGASFLELIKMSGEYDYYAFSDQDDVWESLKLIKAVDKTNKSEEKSPIMYCSNCTIVNSNLEKIGMLHSKKNIIPNKKATALVQGFAHGCTMVLNRKSKDLVLLYQPNQNYAHDFWIPLIHIFLGSIVYDQNSYVLYRQHNHNVYGKKRSLFRLIKLKFVFIKHSKNYYSQMAKDLLVGYSNDLNKIDYQQLKDISEYKSSVLKRIKLLFNKDIKRNTFRGTLVLKMLILLSKF